MTRSLVLHLGDHKTGSTSIQHALATGRVVSEQTSLFYPRGKAKVVNHNHAVRGLKGEQDSEGTGSEFAALATEIQASTADVAILSAEAFERADPTQVLDTLKQHLPDLTGQTRLIVYVRPHADRLVSTYAERVKQGLFQGNLTEFFHSIVADGSFFYAPRFLRWREVFGESLTVRPFVRNRLKDGDVVADFLDFALRGAPFNLPPAAPLNEKVAMADLSLLLALQSSLLNSLGRKKSYREPGRTLGWRLARMLGASAAGADRPLPALHHSLAVELVETFSADAAEMDKSFFDNEPLLSQALAAAPNTAIATPQSTRLEDHFDGEALRLNQAFIALTTQIYALNPEDWLQHFKDHPLRLKAEQAD